MCIARLIEAQAGLREVALGELGAEASGGAPPAGAGAQGASSMAKDNHVLDKTRLCRFFRKGQCARGEACSFAHGRRQLRPQPDLYRTQLCLDFQKTGACGYGAECRYAHSLAELRPPEVAAAPASGGRCRAGAEAAEPAGAASSADDPPMDALARELELVQERARLLQEQIDLLEGTGCEAPGCDKASGAPAPRSRRTSACGSSASGRGGVEAAPVPVLLGRSPLAAAETCAPTAGARHGAPAAAARR